MNAARLLSDLAGQGFALSIEGGRLIVSPSSRLTENARAEIRTHKAEILAVLAANDSDPISFESDPNVSSVVSQENKDRPYRLWWILHGPDDWRLHSFTTPATLAEVQGWYPGCLIEPVTVTMEQRP